MHAAYRDNHYVPTMNHVMLNVFANHELRILAWMLNVFAQYRHMVQRALHRTRYAAPTREVCENGSRIHRQMQIGRDP